MEKITFDKKIKKLIKKKTVIQFLNKTENKSKSILSIENSILVLIFIKNNAEYVEK